VNKEVREALEEALRLREKDRELHQHSDEEVQAWKTLYEIQEAKTEEARRERESIRTLYFNLLSKAQAGIHVLEELLKKAEIERDEDIDLFWQWFEDSSPRVREYINLMKSEVEEDDA